MQDEIFFVIETLNDLKIWEPQNEENKIQWIFDVEKDLKIFIFEFPLSKWEYILKLSHSWRILTPCWIKHIIILPLHLFVEMKFDKSFYLSSPKFKLFDRLKNDNTSYLQIRAIYADDSLTLIRAGGGGRHHPQ